MDLILPHFGSFDFVLGPREGEEGEEEEEEGEGGGGGGGGGGGLIERESRLKKARE